VANADEAIKALETCDDIRTIFTDVDLPGSMDGLKLAAAVRDRWPPVNIIVTTGMRAPHHDDMPARSLFVAKPYRSAEVLEAVRLSERFALNRARFVWRRTRNMARTTTFIRNLLCWVFGVTPVAILSSSLSATHSPSMCLC
jgi:DNA-binding LytR/AlgR family response regulator